MRRISERFRRRLAEVTGAGESASRLAAAWAVGLAIAFSPFLGAQTLLALAIAIAFRLNKIDTLLGTLVVNPWTLAVYFPAATLLGQRLTGIPLPALDVEPASLLSLEVWRAQAAGLRPLLLCWLAGASATAAVVGVVAYLAIRRAVVLHRRRLTSAPGTASS